MEILVTGNAGFIGSHFVDVALKLGHKVVGVDGMLEGSCGSNLLDENRKAKCDQIFANVECLSIHTDILSKGHNPELITHFSALSNVDTSIDDPELFDTNYLATSRICKIAKEFKIPLIIVSSDEVYGSYSTSSNSSYWSSELKELGFDEDQILNPSSVYSASKAASDLLALSYHKTYGLDVRITRCSNNFGTRQQDKLIPTIIKKGLAGEEITIFETPALRDWLHVYDHCSAIFTVIEKGKAGEVYNVSANAEKSPQEVVELFGFSNLIKIVKDRPGYDLRYFVNSSKLRNLGWKPEYTLEESVPELLEWYKKAFATSYFDEG
jgi:dTDP-glucose 4,6-dehydratase